MMYGEKLSMIPETTFPIDVHSVSPTAKVRPQTLIFYLSISRKSYFFAKIIDYKVDIVLNFKSSIPEITNLMSS